MSNLFLRSILLAFVAAAAGCATPEPLQEHAVNRAPPPLPAGVYRLAEVDVKPAVTHEVEPEFPPELGEVLQGRALVVFTVKPDGKVADPDILQADDILFGEAGVDAIRKWRFKPAELHGVPVPCRMTMPFIFTSPYGYYPGDLPTPPDPGDTPPDDAHSQIVK